MQRSKLLTRLTAIIRPIRHYTDIKVESKDQPLDLTNYGHYSGPTMPQKWSL